MRYSRVKKICLVCDTEFAVIKAREHTAKFCSHRCSSDYNKGKPTWNAGTKYEDTYTEEQIKEIKSKQSRPGHLNPMWKRNHTEETKQQMSELKVGKSPWNKGIETPGVYCNRDQSGLKNPSVHKIMKEENLETYEEYEEFIKNRRGPKKHYRERVSQLSKKQPIHELENYDKWGDKGGYDLDHIYPVSEGYKRGIPEEVISDIRNLQFIPRIDNIKKSNKVTDESSIFLRESISR
jgi:hypothetical protein